MSETTDALSELLDGYELLLSSSGEVVTLPRDPVAPRVASSLDRLEHELLYRADQERGLDLYANPQKVHHWLLGRATILTSGRVPSPVSLRVRQTQDASGPRLLVDLGDPEVGTYLDVRAGAWTVVDPRDPAAPPVAERPVFVRPDGDFRPLPVPVRPDVRGEGREWLRVALNLSDRDWRLVWGWMLAAYFDRWDRQGLLFVAPTKLGKTLRASWLLRFVHPGDRYSDGIGADLPGPQREWASLIAENPVLAFDDVEHITAAQHANLKRVATGVAFRTQTLYKTRGITVTRGKRPMLLTASGTPSGLRDDLRNRLWLVEPTAPPVGERLRDEFERRAPAIFADLLDDLAGALSFYLEAERELAVQVSETGVPVRPLEVTALFRALDRSRGPGGWASDREVPAAGGFEEAAREALADSLMEAAEGDRFAFAVRALLGGPKYRDGGELSSQAFLIALEDEARALFPDVTRFDREDWFPNDPTRMGAMLNRKADSLAAAGVRLSARKLDRSTRGWAWEAVPPEHRLDVGPPAAATTAVEVRRGDGPRLGDFD